MCVPCRYLRRLRVVQKQALLPKAHETGILVGVTGEHRHPSSEYRKITDGARCRGGGGLHSVGTSC
jgi:hypothetical protein